MTLRLKDVTDVCAELAPPGTSWIPPLGASDDTLWYAYLSKQTTEGHPVRLHSSFLETSDLRRAARVAGVGFTRLNLKGSRSRDHAFDFILTGHSPRRQNFGGEDYAATYDEWGVLLGVLFDLDPTAVVPGVYQSGEHFHWATTDRYREGMPADTHPQHKWEWAGDVVTGSYRMHHCTKCSATLRYLLGKRTLADLG